MKVAVVLNGDEPGADTYLSGHPYILQEQWSNAQDLVLGCTMGP